MDGLDTLVARAIVDTDPGISIPLSGDHKSTISGSVLRPDDYGLQHFLDLFPDDDVVERGQTESVVV